MFVSLGGRVKLPTVLPLARFAPRTAFWPTTVPHVGPARTRSVSFSYQDLSCGRFVRKVSGRIPEGFRKVLGLWPCPYPSGKFLRKVLWKIFAEGSAEGFCGRFRGRFSEGFSRKEKSMILGIDIVRSILTAMHSSTSPKTETEDLQPT